MVTGQKWNRVVISYLQGQTLTLVLNRFKPSADGWRSSESDNDAVQCLSLWQREGNYLSVLRTNQKRMEATWGPIIFPRGWGVRLLYAHWALNIASNLLIAPLLRLHYASWAYLRSSYVHIAQPLRLWHS